VTDEKLLAAYAELGVFTGLDGFEAEIDALPAHPASAAAVVQGMLMHEALGHLYGITLPDERREEIQLHGAAAMLALAQRLEPGPLTRPRPPERRVLGNCRHFATLFVAIMRRKGVPARARCGFANYFAPGKHFEHWVGEYWNGGEQCWVLVDAQVDAVQREVFQIDFDPLDVARDRFLVGGAAWRACRSGADPMTFGVAGTENWGILEVYGELFQDLAALQKIELMPWGWYGLALEKAGMGETELLDDLARISSQADADALARLREKLATDERLRVPEEVITKALEADRARLGRFLGDRSSTTPG
jgi:Transglutaminase-like superfamily